MRNSPTQIERIGPWPVPSPPPVVIPTGETWGKDERDKVWIEVGLHVKRFLKHGPMGTGPEIPQSTTMLNSKRRGREGGRDMVRVVKVSGFWLDPILHILSHLIYHQSFLIRAHCQLLKAFAVVWSQFGVRPPFHSKTKGIFSDTRWSKDHSSLPLHSIHFIIFYSKILLLYILYVISIKIWV